MSKSQLIDPEIRWPRNSATADACGRTRNRPQRFHDDVAAEAAARLPRLLPTPSEADACGGGSSSSGGGGGGGVWRALAAVHRLELERAAAAAEPAPAAAEVISCLCRFYGVPGGCCTNCLGAS
jgi:hypothetical protein